MASAPVWVQGLAEKIIKVLPRQVRASQQDVDGEQLLRESEALLALLKDEPNTPPPIQLVPLLAPAAALAAFSAVMAAVAVVAAAAAPLAALLMMAAAAVARLFISLFQRLVLHGGGLVRLCRRTAGGGLKRDAPRDERRLRLGFGGHEVDGLRGALFF